MTGIIRYIVTWFGSGNLPGALGTWGSLAALPFAWLIASAAGPWGLLAASGGVFLLGLWASERYSQSSGVKDPQNIVIDEVAGQWLALVFAPLSLPGYFAGFVLFRLCDIFKPWPADWADRTLSGGLGIMLDDMVAGAYALLLMQLGLYMIRQV